MSASEHGGACRIGRLREYLRMCEPRCNAQCDKKEYVFRQTGTPKSKVARQIALVQLYSAAFSRKILWPRDKTGKTAGAKRESSFRIIPLNIVRSPKLHLVRGRAVHSRYFDFIQSQINA